MNLLAKIDNASFNYIAAHPSIQANKRIPKVFAKISKTGDGSLYATIAILVFLLEKENGTLFLLNAAIAYAFEIPLYLILKQSFKRKRPCDAFTSFDALIQPADKFSLPSGHTAAAFLMATIISYFYSDLTIFVYCWATLIGISRLILKVHYVLDVLVGAILGCSVALVCIFYYGLS
jgi:undecaprenyl-diphosphatase